MCISAQAWQGSGVDLLWPHSCPCACASTVWLKNLVLLILNHNGVYIIELMQVILRYKSILRSFAFSFPCWLNGSSPKVVKYYCLHVCSFGLSCERHSHFSLEVCLCIEVHLIFLFMNLDSKYLHIKSSVCPNPWLLDIRLASFNWVEEWYSHQLHTCLSGNQKEV